MFIIIIIIPEEMNRHPAEKEKMRFSLHDRGAGVVVRSPYVPDLLLKSGSQPHAHGWADQKGFNPTLKR